MGVVVDRSGVLQSKNGKRFMTFKVSDLEKFDLQKVRKSIASQSAESQKTHMKQFNSNGYRVVSLMVFGDQASACHKRC